MKRHVFVAILLGSATFAVSAQAPQPKSQSGPLVDSSRLLVQIEQTPDGNHEGLRGPRSTGHVCQPRGSPAEREKPSAL